MWAEERQGTNGVGTCLALGKGVIIRKQPLRHGNPVADLYNGSGTEFWRDRGRSQLNELIATMHVPIACYRTLSPARPLALKVVISAACIVTTY